MGFYEGSIYLFLVVILQENLHCSGMVFSFLFFSVSSGCFVNFGSWFVIFVQKLLAVDRARMLFISI